MERGLLAFCNSSRTIGSKIYARLREVQINATHLQVWFWKGSPKQLSPPSSGDGLEQNRFQGSKISDPIRRVMRPHEECRPLKDVGLNPHALDNGK